MIYQSKTAIPQGWQLIKLGDVIELQYGKSLIKSKRDGGAYLVYGSNGVVGSHSKFLIEKSCLIVGRKGTIGEVTFSGSPCWAIDTTYYIDKLYEQPIKFWFYRLKALELDKLDRASAVPGLNREDAYKLVFPLPPLNEQKRILAKIEALQTRSTAVKEELQAIKPLLDQFRQSVLAAAFRGDLTKEWREQNPDVELAEVLLERIKVERRQRWEEAELEKMKAKGKVPKNDKWKKKYKEPEPIDTGGLPAIPETWSWIPLSELGELNRGKSKHRPRKDPVLFGGDYPFIQTGDIRAANGILTTFSQTYNEFGLKQSRLWDEGTLCITIAANIADTAILGIPACFPDSVVGLLPDCSICDVRFVEYFIRTAKHNLESFAPATAQKNINLEILKVLAIPFISLEEQQEIVRRIESLFKLADSIEQQYQQAEVDIETLNQSILAKAFRGELVPQDPNDEPASVLLERIREEREKAKPKKSKSKRKSSSKKQDKQLGIPGM